MGTPIPPNSDRYEKPTRRTLYARVDDGVTRQIDIEKLNKRLKKVERPIPHIVIPEDMHVIVARASKERLERRTRIAHDAAERIMKFWILREVRRIGVPDERRA